MKHKLTKIKEESQALTAEISHDLRKSSNELKRVSKVKPAQPPFRTLDDFDRWFNSDEPLHL